MEDLQHVLVQKDLMPGELVIPLEMLLIYDRSKQAAGKTGANARSVIDALNQRVVNGGRGVQITGVEYCRTLESVT